MILVLSHHACILRLFLLASVFVHQTSIQSDGFRYLKVGERVEFELEDTARGPQARNVTGPGGVTLEREAREHHHDE